MFWTLTALYSRQQAIIATAQSAVCGTCLHVSGMLAEATKNTEIFTFPSLETESRSFYYLLGSRATLYNKLVCVYMVESARLGTSKWQSEVWES